MLQATAGFNADTHVKETEKAAAREVAPRKSCYKDARENDEEVLPISQEDFKVIIGEHIVDFVTTC